MIIMTQTLPDGRLQQLVKQTNIPSFMKLIFHSGKERMHRKRWGYELCIGWWDHEVKICLACVRKINDAKVIVSNEKGRKEESNKDGHSKNSCIAL